MIDLIDFRNCRTCNLPYVYDPFRNDFKQTCSLKCQSELLARFRSGAADRLRDYRSKLEAKLNSTFLAESDRTYFKAKLFAVENGILRHEGKPFESSNLPVKR